MNAIFQTPSLERSRVPRILGYGLALAYLIWVLRDFHIVRVIHDIANVDWKWVLLGMAFDVLSYGVQAVRWKFLLTPFGNVRLSRAIRAVYAGLFANLVLPLRPGEFLRSFLLGNSEHISLGRVLGSVGVERLIDLVIATASLAVVSLVVELPQRFRRIADTLGIITLIVLAILVALILYLELKLGNVTVEEGQRTVSGRFMSALSALHAMGTSPSFYPSVLISLFLPFCQVVGLWAMMRSYSLNLPFLAAVVVLLVINLGVSLPNAPANVGSYQFFCVLGLSVFQTDRATAAGFSVFAFLALTFPFLILGFIALVRSGLSLRSMREKVAGLPGQVREAPLRT